MPSDPIQPCLHLKFFRPRRAPRKRYCCRLESIVEEFKKLFLHSFPHKISRRIVIWPFDHKQNYYLQVLETGITASFNVDGLRKAQTAEAEPRAGMSLRDAHLLAGRAV
jgi:hypothetical protein